MNRQQIPPLQLLNFIFTGLHGYQITPGLTSFPYMLWSRETDFNSI